MSDLLSSRWAPSAGTTYNNTNPSLRRPRSETPLRANNPSPTRRTPNFTYVNGSGYGYGYDNGGNNNISQLPPHEELARFMKIVSRLRWKLPFLAEAYRLATLSTETEAQSTESSTSTSMSPSTHAEIMFKIDFHEYYALLERAIVHLLAIFNITVSSTPRRTTTTTNNTSTGNAGNTGNAGIHRYHANVLQALESESTPLTPVLGSGPTIIYLRQAKELRNRWKTADMTADEKGRDPIGDRSRTSAPLSSYNFEEILLGIFAGLEEGYLRALAHVEMCRRPGEAGGGGRVEGEGEREEDGWGFMVDAMDWEAV